MALITIGQGGSDIPDGNYEMMLTGIVPKIIIPRQGDNAGKEVEVLEWTFSDIEDESVEISALSSTVFTPKSKAVAWITALLGPDAAKVGASFDAEDLLGRKAMVQIKTDEGGYPKIVAVTPMPVRRKARPAPVEDTEDDGLPF